MTGGCWTIFERYLAMTSSRHSVVVDGERVAPFFGRPTFLLKRISRDSFSRQSYRPFSDMIEGGLCLLGQSKTSGRATSDVAKRAGEAAADATRRPWRKLSLPVRSDVPGATRHRFALFL
jgi:hypothetical protein